MEARGAKVKSQIAKHLKIEASQILKVEEWVSCYFVVLAGKGGRFVSKSAVKREVVAKVMSLVEGYAIAAKEIQNVEVYNNQVHVRVRGQLTYCGLSYFQQLVKEQLAA